MLEYVKAVLSKVSFDRKLFEKELKKAIGLLVPQELKELKTWCYRKFGDIYQQILNNCFAQVAI